MSKTKKSLLDYFPKADGYSNMWQGRLFEGGCKTVEDTNVYKEISGDVISPLVKIMKYHLTKVKLRGDIIDQT